MDINERKKWWANALLSVILGSFGVLALVMLSMAIYTRPIIAIWVFGIVGLIFATAWAAANS